MCTGIGNGILTSFLDFVDKKIENLPTGLGDIRATTILLIVELDEYKVLKSGCKLVGQNLQLLFWRKQGLQNKLQQNMTMGSTF